MNKKNYLTLSKKIGSKNINLIMAFAGWADAKRVATYATEYLRDKLKAYKIGEIDSAPFYDFAIERPLVNIKNGLMKEYSPPLNELYYAKEKSLSQGILIMIGTEPHTNWTTYVESIFQKLDHKRIKKICLLGGLIDRIPHTIDPMISGVANTQALVEELKQNEIEPAEYSGPSSIHSLILKESGKRRISAISIWGHAPEYAEVDPRTAYQLLTKVKAFMKIDINLEELQTEASLYKKQLDLLMKQDSSFAEHVQKLEIEYRNFKRSLGYLA